MAETIVLQTGANRNKEQLPSLWSLWWDGLLALRPAFSHIQAFMWFTVLVAGITIRTDLLGVSSIMRVLRLQSRCYAALLRNCHSRAIRLDALTGLWASAVLRLFPTPLRINNRLVLIADGIKVAKSGKKMPGVKRLHQQSENKAEWINGHSLQAVSLLVPAAQSFAAVPIAIRIHEGIIWSNRHKKTLLNKLIALLGIVNIKERCYLVADAFYANCTMIVGLNAQGNHLITRVRSNAVANLLYEHHGPRKRGRPRLYGPKIPVASLLKETGNTANSPVYGEQNVILRYVVRDLMWRPVGKLVRFVGVEHPARGVCLLMSTDLTLDAIDIIRAYGLRFKIEYAFKQAVHVIGTFSYHLWMKAMIPLRRGSGDQYLHRKPLAYREAVKRKLHAYHVFLQAGVVAQGLIQYLSITASNVVWRSFGSWLRTIRPGIVPSEFVTAEALRRSLPEFLLSSTNQHPLTKFLHEHQNQDTAGIFGVAA
jgi:hypothetical protein